TADYFAFVLRGGEPRRRVAVAAVPVRDAAAADADHRRRDDLLGADDVHRFSADLRDHARGSAQCDAPDGDALVPACDLGRESRRGRGDRDGDGPVSAGSDPVELFRVAASRLATRRGGQVKAEAASVNGASVAADSQGMNYLTSLP